MREMRIGMRIETDVADSPPRPPKRLPRRADRRASSAVAQCDGARVGAPIDDVRPSPNSEHVVVKGEHRDQRAGNDPAHETHVARGAERGQAPSPPSAARRNAIPGGSALVQGRMNRISASIGKASNSHRPAATGANAKGASRRTIMLSLLAGSNICNEYPGDSDARLRRARKTRKPAPLRTASATSAKPSRPSHQIAHAAEDRSDEEYFVFFQTHHQLRDRPASITTIAGARPKTPQSASSGTKTFSEKYRRSSLARPAITDTRSQARLHARAVKPSSRAMQRQRNRGERNGGA